MLSHTSVSILIQISASCYRIRRLLFQTVRGFRIKYDDPTFSGFYPHIKLYRIFLLLAVALPVHFPMHYTDSISLFYLTRAPCLHISSFLHSQGYKSSGSPCTCNCRIIFILRNHLYFRHPVLSHVLQKFRYRQCFCVFAYL